MYLSLLLVVGFKVKFLLAIYICCLLLSKDSLLNADTAKQAVPFTYILHYYVCLIVSLQFIMQVRLDYRLTWIDIYLTLLRLPHCIITVHHASPLGLPFDLDSVHVQTSDWGSAGRRPIYLRRLWVHHHYHLCCHHVVLTTTVYREFFAWV